MEFNNLLLDIDGQVAVVTVNRPAKLNALNADTLKELERLFAEIGANPGIKVVILTGAGDRSFGAGGDIAAIQAMTPIAARNFALMAQKVLNDIEQCPQPVIAAVNGYALGGGCELALCCDLRVVSETAKFGQPEINLGIIPGWAATQRLPRLIGKGRAMEMLLTGEPIDAQEAYRIGLANKVVSPPFLLDEARKLARKIVEKGQIAVRLCKEAVVHGLEMDSARACAYEADLFALCFSTRDQKEGMAAFLAKRAPRFLDN